MMQARAGLTGVSVTWAFPGADMPKEAVFMSAAEFLSEQIVALRHAPHKHDETYVVPVWVDVLSEGNDAHAAELRMYVLVAEVEDGLRLAPSLSDATGVLSAIVTGKQPSEYTSDQGWGARCRINVTVKGRG